MKRSKLLYFITKLDSNRLLHSLKTAIAFLLGLIIVRLFDFPQGGQWILISILVVMCAQSRVGAMMQKSYMRFLGTVLGASIAALTLWLAYPSIVWTTLILCITTALFSYIADSPNYFSEAGPLGAVTTVIILIGQDPSYQSVLSRFFEISLGIIIALLISRFIWPLHSHTQFRYIVATTLQDLAKLMHQLKIFPSFEVEKNYQDYEIKIINRFTTQTKLLDEVLRESFGRRSLASIFKGILQGEREVLRCINLMKSALMNFSSSARLIFNDREQVDKIYEMSNQLLKSLAKQLSVKNENIVAVEVTANWKEEMQGELNTLIVSKSDKLAVDLFIFAAGSLITQLKKINHLVKKI